MTFDDLRARILGIADGVASTTVTVPEWGDVTVNLRRLSLAERLEFEAINGSLEDLDRKKHPVAYVKYVVRYVIALACHADGTPLFSAADEDLLAKKSATAVERVALAGIKVNTVTAEDVAALGKHSGEVRNGASPSALPATSESP
jgi:hypothetical protein